MSASKGSCEKAMRANDGTPGLFSSEWTAERARRATSDYSKEVVIFGSDHSARSRYVIVALVYAHRSECPFTRPHTRCCLYQVMGCKNVAFLTSPESCEREGGGVFVYA